MVTNRQQITERFKEAITSFNAISLLWLAVLFAMSLFEVLYNGVIHPYPDSLLKVAAWAFWGDVTFLFSYLFKLFLVYLAVCYISVRVAKTLYKIFIVTALVIQIVLIKYFAVTLLPLGADIYGYSIADIRQTIGASGGLNFGVVLLLLVFIGVLVVVFKYLPEKLQINFKTSAAVTMLSLVPLFIARPTLVHPGNLQSDFASNLIMNKSDFFYSASLDHFFPTDDDPDIYADSYIGDYGSAKVLQPSFTYVDPANYPFLHADSTADVLSPFLKPAATPPNIVILLVEGLGSAFTGDGAYLGNFTPFIDSLANKSLYWPNFLSEGGRTFAALPSLLGSLPFAKNGFLEMGDQMPPHLSLLSLLKDNGYYTSFYYGGDAHFDNMELFLRRNKIDELNDQRSFPGGYTKMPAVNGFTWGYGDKELFRHYFATRLSAQQRPQLSIILTVSTHNPFIFNEQDTYLKRFEQRMAQLGFDETKKSEYRNYKNQYASILYMDDAVKGFFAAYSKRADYTNTIFLITGDHRMPEIPMRDKIDRYHVPLIVYSPMLKRTSQIASVSTHFDITPSLLAYLKRHYHIKSPRLVSWMGQGLDTTISFRNIHSYPLIQTKTDMVDFIRGDYHINGNTLFKLSPDLSETAVQDEEKLNELKHAFEQFKNSNNQLIKGAPLLPDSIKQHY
ncbi:MAG: LTA synthase family protein [Mucilaginibacter sp.]